MPDYQNGKIYKIVDLDSNDCYIGSTTLALSQRLAQHVSSYKRWLKGKTNFVTSYIIIEKGDYDIVLIENYPCNSKEELHARESHYSQTIPSVNKVKNQGFVNALGGQMQYKKKYYDDHQVQNKVRAKQYREQHKEQIKQKKNNITNKIKIKTKYKRNRS